MTKEQIVEQMATRDENAQNIWTGEPLSGEDLKEWRTIQWQREYSLAENPGK